MNFGGMKKGMLPVLILWVLLLALLVPSLAVAEDEPPTQYAPWREDYVLVVELATEDPERISYTDNQLVDARIVMVSFSEMSQLIQTQDINDYYMDFTLRSASGTEYPAEAFGVRQIRIVNNAFTMDGTQEGFSLFFAVPNDVALDDLTLYVDTAKESEHITVALAKVPQE